MHGWGVTERIGQWSKVVLEVSANKRIALGAVPARRAADPATALSAD